jgi:hypothetical protein
LEDRYGRIRSVHFAGASAFTSAQYPLIELASPRKPWSILNLVTGISPNSRNIPADRTRRSVLGSFVVSCKSGDSRTHRETVAGVDSIGRYSPRSADGRRTGSRVWLFPVPLE